MGMKRAPDGHGAHLVMFLLASLGAVSRRKSKKGVHVFLPVFLDERDTGRNTRAQIGRAHV